MGVIYKITTPTGKIYVGQTIDHKRRISDYRFKHKRYNTMIFNSINKYGWETHIMEILEEVEDSRLNDREIFWIKELNTYHVNNPNGINMTTGGFGHRGSWMHDTERRKRESEKRMGELGSFYGQKHTEENKKIMSDFRKEFNKENNVTVPKWGAEKGRLKVIKAVVLYNAKGKFIREYESGTEAAKYLKLHHSSISESCRMEISAVEGKYIFRYKTENYPLKIEVGIIKKKAVKRPVLCFIGSHCLEYPSSKEASEDLGIPKTTINRAAQYNKSHPIRTGHVFIYKDEFKNKLPLDKRAITA